MDLSTRTPLGTPNRTGTDTPFHLGPYGETTDTHYSPCNPLGIQAHSLSLLNPLEESNDTRYFALESLGNPRILTIFFVNLVFF